MNTTLSLRDAEALAVGALEAVGVPRWEAEVSARALIAPSATVCPRTGCRGCLSISPRRAVARSSPTPGPGSRSPVR